MHQNEQLLPQARTNDLVTQELPEEVLVYDLKDHKAHCLNQTAAAVWKHCDGKTSVMEMTTLIKQDINQTMDEATVWQAIGHLGKANLLEARVTPPAGIPRLGRREAIRRLGLGSAIAVPVVMSILAPTVLAGCTFDNQPIGTPCCTSSQCGTFMGSPLQCCPAGSTCLVGLSDPCTVNANCCSNNCTGSPLTCQP